MNNRLYSLVVLSLFTLCAGCSGSSHYAIDDWMAEASKDMKGTVEPLPQAKPYTFFIYQASNLPDPFSPLKMSASKQANGLNDAGNTRVREPLEGFDLNKLSMVGTMKKGSATYALIKEPAGRVYRVQVGNYMGMDSGKIIKISENEIDLSETIEDQNGEWVQKATQVYLEEQQTQN